MNLSATVRRGTRPAALLAAAIFVLVAGVACGGEPGHLKACDTRVVEGPYGHPAGIVASTVTVCDTIPAGAFTVIATFEVNIGSGDDPEWVHVDTDGCVGLPSPNHPVECDHVAEDACVPGFDYRVRVSVSGRGPDGRDFFWAMPEQPQQHIADCPRRR